MFTEQLSEALAVVGLIAPTNHTNNTDNTLAAAGGIDMAKFKRLLAVGLIGVLNANIQGYWVASAQSNMNVVTNVASSIPLTASTANNVFFMELRGDQVPANLRYVSPVFIVNTGASFFGAVILGGESPYKPAKQWDLANTISNRAIT